MSQGWYQLWTVPTVSGWPVSAGQWVSLGWIYGNTLQLEILKTMVSCCSKAFSRWVITGQDGAVLFFRDC